MKRTSRRTGLRGWLLVVLASLGSAEVVRSDKVDELLLRLGTSKDPDKDPALAELLKREDVQAEVLAALGTSEVPEVLGGAVLALGHLGKRAQAATKELLAESNDSPLQLKLMEGIGVAGARAAWLQPQILDLAGAGYAALAKSLKDETSGFERLEERTSYALITLGMMGGEARKPLAQIEKFLALKIDMANEAGMKCRVDAACALWRLSGAKQRVLEILGPALDCRPDGRVAASAVFALGEMGAHAASLRPRLEGLRATVPESLRGSIQVALDKIDGKQPVVGPKPDVP